MNDETEFEGERRPLLKRRRPEPKPSPDDEPEPDRRRPLLRLGRGLAAWLTLAGELPVVLRLFAWGVLLLLVALVFRTFRGARK